MQSRLVRNEMVYFYWTMRRDAVNPNSLQKEQIINHFTKAGSFTTKVHIVLFYIKNDCSGLLLSHPTLMFNNVFSLSVGVVCEPEEAALV